MKKKAIVLLLAILMFGVAMAGCLQQSTEKKNKPPIADFKIDIEHPTHNELITFDASASWDKDKKDNESLEYEWDFGDEGKINKSKNSKIVTHFYEKDGTYEVTLYVYDKKTLTQKSMNLTVTNQVPVIDDYYPKGDPTVQESSMLELGVNASDEPNDDLLLYQWSIDGTDLDGETSKVFQYHPSLADEGTYDIVVKVSDINGGTVQQAWSVNVTNLNQAPTIVNFGPVTTDVTVAEESAQIFTVTASDPDGDTLTYTWYNNDIPIPGQTGTSYTYGPTYNDSGSYVIKVGVSDGDLETFVTWNVTVSNTNRGPVILAITPDTEDVFINESDTVDFTVTAEDPDGDILNYEWKLDTDVLPDYNGLAFASFTPDLTMAGEYTMTVTVLDGKGKSAVNIWDITVNNKNQPPSITNFEPASDPVNTDEETEVEFSVTASDPDGDTLTYQWFLNGTAVPGETGSTYTLVPDYTMGGTTQKVHKVNVTVYDPDDLNCSNEWGVIIDNINRPPVAAASVNMTKPGIGLEVQFDASASTDPDGQILSFIWNFGDGTSPQAGNPLDHKYKYPGVYTATVTVSDGIDEDTADVIVDVNITQSWASASLGEIGPLVVADVDNDGVKEIIFGAYASTDGTTLTGYLYIFDGVTHQQQHQSGNVGKVMDIEIANVDGDPAVEIIFGTQESLTPSGSGGDYEGRVWAIDGVTPTTTDLDSGIMGMVTAVAVDNMDDDGDLEIVALQTDTFRQIGDDKTYFGNMSIFGYDGGSIVNEWNSVNLCGMGTALEIDDIDGDSYNETVFGTYDTFDTMTGYYHGSVMTLGYTGATYLVESTNSNVGEVTALAVGDPDSDTNTEVVIGSHERDLSDHKEGFIYVFTSDLVQEYKGSDVGFVTCLELLDADEDTVVEIIFGVNYNETENENDPSIIEPEGYLYILNGNSHAQKFKSNDIGAVTSIAFGNLDNDGRTEIVVGTWDRTNHGDFEGRLYAFFYDMTTTSFKQLWNSSDMGMIGYDAVVVDDVDGDGSTDIICGTNDNYDSPFAGKVFVLTNKNKD
jgi:PKD repeat protein